MGCNCNKNRQTKKNIVELSKKYKKHTGEETIIIKEREDVYRFEVVNKHANKSYVYESYKDPETGEIIHELISIKRY